MSIIQCRVAYLVNDEKKENAAAIACVFLISPSMTLHFVLFIHSIGEFLKIKIDEYFAAQPSSGAVQHTPRLGKLSRLHAQLKSPSCFEVLPLTCS